MCVGCAPRKKELTFPPPNGLASDRMVPMRSLTDLPADPDVAGPAAARQPAPKPRPSCAPSYFVTHCGVCMRWVWVHRYSCVGVF